MKRSVEVEIAGQRLTIRSDEGPEYVAELAEYVDAHLQALGGRKTVSPHRVALLVAMQIADELFREKDLHYRLRHRVGQKLQDLRAAVGEHEARLAALEAAPAQVAESGDA
ncbi:MAG: cell division protein ZapA [Nannocystaceae bacterium]